MFLEGWIQERMGGCSDIREYKLARLKETLDYVVQESPFYKHLFAASGVSPDDLRGLNDLALLPFTTAEDLKRQPYKVPCMSLSRVKRVFSLYTGGTSGAPKLVFFAEADLDRIADYMGAAMKSVAISASIAGEGFRAYIILPNGKPESQQKMLEKGVRGVGAVPLLGDLALDSAQQLERIEQVRPDIVFGPVSRVYRLSQEGSEERDLSALGVRVIFITSEYVPAAMRESLSQLWKAEVFTHYGMTEMGWAGGIECEAHHGYHFNEADLLLEVIDPSTGVPVSAGEEGELVLTTLNRHAMPLVRYRTGDLGRLLEGGCGCGASVLQRIGPLVKRKDSIIRLRSGEEIYPGVLDEALHRLTDLISYQCSLVEGDGKERLVSRVELIRPRAAAGVEAAEAVLGIPEIARSVQAGLMLEPEVEVVERGGIKRAGRAKKLIADERSCAG